jgi:hypothetical protein
MSKFNICSTQINSLKPRYRIITKKVVTKLCKTKDVPHLGALTLAEDLEQQSLKQIIIISLRPLKRTIE